MVDVLVIGTGEYVTGLGHGSSCRSDKAAGVVGVTLFDLRQRGLVGRIVLAGRDGGRFAAIRSHFAQQITAPYGGLDASFEAFPAHAAVDSTAWLQALETMPAGAVVIVATPDTAHAGMALAAVRRGLHVMVLKPLVKTLAEHDALASAAAAHQVLVAADYHKRLDPIYTDAVDRIRALGPTSLMMSYMSQPRTQLETFRHWAGLDSDISYYLNAHHIDLHVWAQAGLSRPWRVRAAAAAGIGAGMLGRPLADTIVLTVDWLSADGAVAGVAVYTASWVAPPSDVHSQQRFFHMGTGGEVTVDQAHRGASLATHADGFSSLNPLFMKYTPRQNRFAGQHGYGYRSLELFLRAAQAVSAGQPAPEEAVLLASVASTRQTTAILEAGARSLQADGAAMLIRYDESDWTRPVEIAPAQGG